MFDVTLYAVWYYDINSICAIHLCIDMNIFYCHRYRVEGVDIYLLVVSSI